MLMPSNNTKGIVHFYAGKCPGRIGLLLSPAGWRRVPWYLPYAMDNGCFTGFDSDAWVDFVQKPDRSHPPMWAAVPDAVGDADETSRLWAVWTDEVPWPKAFVVQDGHEPQDVPNDAYCVFVGGSTEWKLANAHRFKGVAEWLHIGRVNTLRRLDWAESIGADSVDGTGWFRGDASQLDGFIQHFEGRRQSCFTY